MTPEDKETQILSNFLLSNSTFPDLIDFKTFRSLFPKHLQDKPQVKHLYNHLTLKRAATLETVRKNIKFEVEISKRLLAREGEETEARNRREDRQMLGQADMAGVMEVYGDLPPPNKLPPIKEVVQALRVANEKLELEMATLDDDCEKLTQEIKDIVGDLSVLKFGGFSGSNEGLVDRVIEDLARLQETCDQVLDAAD